MNILLKPATAVQLEPVQRFVLGCVSWEEYEKFLDAVGERHVRLTYDRGTLELMTLSLDSMKYTRCCSAVSSTCSWSSWTSP